MTEATFRFYAELNDFLPVSRRYLAFTASFDRGTTVKHAVESLGVAHTEIDLILVNGASVDFSYRLEDGDRVSVYPVFESMDISSVSPLRPQPLREPRFILDTHLGRLAVYLRMLGFDTLYSNQADDEDLADISSREQRILLTRDRGLLKRKIVTHGYCVRENQPRKQAVEVIHRFDLTSLVRPFTRCLQCNGVLLPVDKEMVQNNLPGNTNKYFDEFWQCQNCGKIYWKGSHYQNMLKLTGEIA